ncbi:MAG: hypothetical protein RBT11_01805 [Desulfobacterales bacterium]|jgi:lambda repressor-like predicted transcriptional regulator|nr:hypothetical protein [Desulfobacterales bacterium]
MKKEPKDMSPQEIRVAMLLAKVTQAELARRLCVSPSMINRVIDGLTVSDRVRRGIASAINMDVKTIWPSTYIYSEPRKQGRPFCGPKEVRDAA